MEENVLDYVTLIDVWFFRRSLFSKMNKLPAKTGQTKQHASFSTISFIGAFDWPRSPPNTEKILYSLSLKTSRTLEERTSYQNIIYWYHKDVQSPNDASELGDYSFQVLFEPCIYEKKHHILIRFLTFMSTNRIMYPYQGDLNQVERVSYSLCWRFYLGSRPHHLVSRDV